MTRKHREHVLERAPRALARTFTLREAADLLSRSDGEPRGADLAERTRNLVASMAAARSGRYAAAGDDVRDPIDQPIEVHEEVCTLIVETLLPLLGRIADLRVPAGVGA